MPELPEVETIAADLHDAVGGKKIIKVQIAADKIVAGDKQRFIDIISGCRIMKVGRLGKWVHFILEKNNDDFNMLAHLKMTGQFHIGSWPADEKGWGAHDRAAFQLEGLTGADTLFYRDIRKFGRLYAFAHGEMEEFLSRLKLGEDALIISPEELCKRLKKKKGRIKTVLLDQQVLAGLGNIYVDECLFATGISPLMAACDISETQVKSLVGHVRRILSASIKARGSTTSNYQGLKGGGSFQKEHKVYGRGGESCVTCATTIERTVVGGRGTHYCPHCQADKK